MAEGRGQARGRSRSPRGAWAPQAYTGGGGFTAGGLRRVCFQMRFEPGDLQQYIDDHKAVWPEMQSALVACGWHNYSLFLREDGFAVGYFETDVDFKTACARMDKHGVNDRWQEAMKKYTPASVSPVDAASELKHYFYLGGDRCMVRDGTIPAPPFDAAWKPQSYTGGGGRTRAGRRRICFQMQFAPTALDQHLKEQERVSPEQQKALIECGWHNCSLFYREDGLAVGFVESDADFKTVRTRTDAFEVCKRWQEAMAKYTPAIVGGPVEAACELTHYFYLGSDVAQPDAAGVSS